MLSKVLLIAGRVAPPLMECVVTSQQYPSQPAAPVLLPTLPFDPQCPATCFPCATSTCAVKPTQVLMAPAKPGDWQCSCGFSNFASRTVCFGCQRPRQDRLGGVHVKPGDWACACGTHNFARRTSCMTCDAPKPIMALREPAGGSDRMLPGDWICTSCSAHNFRARVVCVKCSEKKPPAAPELAGVPWTCAACHSANPSSRRDCEICGVLKPGDSWHGAAPKTSTSGHATIPSSAPRPGDWTCPSCSFSNFSSRASCKNCSTARTDDSAVAPPPRPAQELKKGDWTCTCGYHNFARRLRCFGCQAARAPAPAEAAVPPAEAQ